MWIFLSILLAADPAAAPEPAPRPVLSLNEALELAREMHPQVRQARAQAQAAMNTALVNRAQLLPQLNVTGAYSRNTSNFAQAPGSVPSQVSQLQQTQSLTKSSNYYTGALTLTQLIFDFGYTYDQWSSADATAQAQRAYERVALSQVLLGVRTAFFSARAKRANVAVATDNLHNQEKHKTQIEIQVRVGKRPEIDLWQARTDTSNARVALISANSNYLLSLAQLNQAIGREAAVDFDVADEMFPAVEGENTATDTLLTEALQGRPDYIQAEHAIVAQDRSIGSLRGQFLPSLSASASLTDAGPEVDNTALNWRVSLNLNWALFGSGETFYAVRSAEATLVSLVAAKDVLRQQVRLDVESARLAVLGARESLDAAGDALANAEKLLSQAEGRYAAGISSAIELGDAQVAFTTASSQKVQAEYALASARATLLRALGRV